MRRALLILLLALPAILVPSTIASAARPAPVQPSVVLIHAERIVSPAQDVVVIGARLAAVSRSDTVRMTVEFLDFAGTQPVGSSTVLSMRLRASTGGCSDTDHATVAVPDNGNPMIQLTIRVTVEITGKSGSPTTTTGAVHLPDVGQFMVYQAG